MNRNLLVFALLLVLLGIGSGIYFVSFFGLLLLIPSLLSPTRVPPRPAPAPAKQEVRRVSPPPMRTPEVVAPYTEPRPQQGPSVMAAPTSAPMQPQSYVSYGTYGSYGSALFPTSLFPSLSSYVSPPQKPPEAAANKPAERDELIEVGAILFLLKLALG